MQTAKQEKNDQYKYENGGSFKIKVGKTTYTVNVFFNKESKVSPEDKIKRMIREDVKYNVPISVDTVDFKAHRF